MTKGHDSTKNPEDKIDESQFNSAGAARRRLICALGGTSGAVLGGALMSGWQKPIVESVLIPAHAQTSDETPAPTACNNEFGWTIMMTSPTPVDISLALFLNGSAVTSDVFPSASAASLSLNSTTSTGSADASLGFELEWSHTSIGSFSFPYTFDATCCTDNFQLISNAGFAAAGTVPLQNLAAVQYPADGQCQMVRS